MAEKGSVESKIACALFVQDQIHNVTMKMKTLYSITLILLILLSLVSLPAKAALLQATDPRFGANSLTIDTSTQLAWLNLSKSAGLSYNQVLADTAPGGIFNGYRFATDDEILGLIYSAGIPGPGFYPLTNGPIQSFISLVGPLGTDYGWPSVQGLTGSGSGSGGVDAAGIFAVGIDGTIEYGVADGPYGPAIMSTYGQAFSWPTMGSWLVMQVPEPSACFIITGGLMGFALLMRCKSQPKSRPKRLGQIP